MAFQKGVVNQTTMSLDERFTQLRRGGEGGSSGIRVGARARIENRIQSATAKNRRLAMQMARRPAVIAALNFRRGQGLQRNAFGGSLSSLATPRFGRANSVRGNFRSSRSRSQRIVGSGRLTRSQSLQSLSGRSTSSLIGRLGISSRGRGNVGGLRGGRGITRGRMFRSGSVSRFTTGRFDNFRRGGNLKGRSMGFNRRSGGGFGGRGGGRGGRGFRGGGGGGVGGGGRGRRGGGISRRGGGGTGVRGRGRRNGGNMRGKMPNKETLDKELDQYMSSSKTALDKEIDKYMNETEENWD